MERHDLVYIKEPGYEFAVSNAYCPLCDTSGLIREILQGTDGRQKVPGIVRTQWKRRPGILDVGYVSDRYLDGNRIRIASSVRTQDIERVVHPWEIFERRTAWPEEPAKILGKLDLLAKKCHCRLGLFGSVALQTMTGRNYIRKESDIDLVLYPEPDTDLDHFYRELLQLQQAFSARCDVEVVMGEVGNAKLHELRSDSTTVLCKSLYGPSVYKKETLKKIF